jgi:prepilin-type N-terminal cleavage/methylation domain-containing protein
MPAFQPSPTCPCRPGRRLRGFTLVELLVVIGIIAILVGLVAGISQHVMNESSRRETTAAQATLKGAINAFHEVMGFDPNTGTSPLMLKDPNSGVYLLNMLRGKAANGAADLPQAKAIQAATMKILAKLPGTALKDGNSGVHDGWGNTMCYGPTGALGDMPLLISAGLNGKFGDSDDIRSDGRGG